MSQPKDIDAPDSGDSGDSGDGGLMLVELLYGERDQAGDRRDMAEASGELAALRELRGLFRELPDEEPPAAITAKLLHAAALHVPAAKAEKKRGFWAWLVSLWQPIAMYPGLAAATTLVLVAGVAGSMYLSGRSQIAEPTVRSEAASAPAQPELAAAPPTDTWKAGDSADRAPATGEAAPSAAQPAEDQVARADTSDGDMAGDMQLQQETKASRSRSSSSSASSSKSGKLAKKPAPQRKARYYEGGLDDGLLAGGAPGGGGSAAPAAPPAPEPQSPMASEQPVASADDMDEEEIPVAETAKSEKSAKKDQGAQVSLLHKRARAAAERGECSVVTELGRQIRDIDPVYYRDSVRTDKLLSACFTSRK